MWNKWSIIHNSNHWFFFFFFPKGLPCPCSGNVANKDWRLSSPNFCSGCSQINTGDFQMVSSFVAWSMKICDCVYLTAGIPNKLSLGSTLNRLVNCLDKKFFFFQQILGWDPTNCTTSECCSTFIYKIADKQICWSVQVSCCIQHDPSTASSHVGL